MTTEFIGTEISPEAQLILQSAREANLIPFDWPRSDDLRPTPSAIDDAVATLRTATNAGRGILEVLQFMDPSLRGYAIIAYLPGVIIGPPILAPQRRSRWEHKFNSSEGDHWRAQRKHLIRNLGYDHSRVESLDKSSDAVLFSLQDPDQSEIPEDAVKGLVVGYVQSGKTANYAATLAKAFDSGYRLVIVLAGIHNELRRQTQIRLENDLGLVASDQFRITARENGQANLDNAIYKLTTSELDGDSIGINVTPDIVTNQRVIAVIKKNVNVMKRLLAWLPKDYSFPVLIIDDEADQASVNSNQGDEPQQEEDGSIVLVQRERTATNRQIVDMIQKFFPRVSYVGYTATPYANVFIDAEDVHDIYPKDFIIPLPKPSGYFGPTEFFGDLTIGGESEGYPNSYSMVNILDANESKIFKDANVEVLRRRKEGLDPSIEIELPAGLRDSIRTYLVASSLFHQRYSNSSNRKPTSMLVQASHIQEVQLATKRAIEAFINQLRRDWRYDEQNRNQIRSSWRALWLEATKDLIENYSKEDDWDVFAKNLDLQLGSYQTQVICLNGQSEDRLDYERTPDFNGVIVGGNKLSRGLTLEGLLTSYFVRETNSPKADTLSQMGRFFGYREDYADLVKVFTTESLLQDFRDIATIEEELREELILYSNTPGKTPSDFGPRVALRGRLMPTSRIGMADKAVSLSGSLLQTTQLLKEDQRDSMGANQRNLDRTIELVDSMTSIARGTSGLSQKNGGQLLWRGIGWPIVKSFLQQYLHSNISRRFSTLSAIQHTEEQIRLESQADLADAPGHSLWNVAVIGNKGSQNGTIQFGGHTIGRSGRSVREGNTADIGSLVNPLQVDAVALTATGDEAIDLDLSALQINELIRKRNEESVPFSLSIRLLRESPLLCIYPLDPNFKGTGKNRAEEALGELVIGGNSQNWPEAIIGLSLVFPRTSEEKKQYLQGNAGRQGNEF